MSKLIYLGHASFLIKGEGFDVVLDPYKRQSVPNMEFPKGIVADQVFCSHDHFDHNARELVKIKGNPQEIKPVEAIVPHDHENGAKRGMNTIRMFDVDGFKVVHLGDTGCVPNSKELNAFEHCDVLLAPINGFFTIGPKELKEIVEIIKPRIIIPMHYYMAQYQSGYPDNNIFQDFKKVFKDFPIESIKGFELDLNQYKDYRGVLVFDQYLQ